MSKELKEVLDFYKSAFCVDGGVKALPTTKNFRITAVVELNDSKRGKFYVGRLEQKESQ